MEFGIMLSATTNEYPIDPNGYAASFRRLATTAEECGLDAVVAGDHIAYPQEVESQYPFSPNGEPPFDYDTVVHDVFQVLSHLAAITDDIALGSNVSIAPLRHPVVLAKHILTLDSLSEGRFELGVGVGWLESEYDILDIPFDERGQRLDEFLELFELIYESGMISFDGEYTSFDETGFYPRPTGDIPVMVGGGSSATIRRVGEFGNGWTAVWAKPEQVSAMRERIMKAWDDYNRTGEPEISVLRPVSVDPEKDGDDSLLVGDPTSIKQDIRQYREAGTTRLILDFYTKDMDEQVEQIQRFGEHILE